MKEITVNKDELISTIKKNMAIHIAEYNELMELYQERAVVKVQELLEKVKVSAKDVSFRIDAHQPTSNEEDYLTALEMLELEVNDTVTISEKEFKNYVKDEWSWTQSFAMSKTAYGI